MALLTDPDSMGNACAGSVVGAGEDDQGQENPVLLSLVLYYLIEQTSTP